MRQLSLDRNDIFETANDQLDPEQYQKLLANQRSWLGRVAERCAAAYDLILLATKQDCVRHAGMARKHDLISYANGKEIPDVARVDTPKWVPLPKEPPRFDPSKPFTQAPALPPGFTETPIKRETAKPAQSHRVPLLRREAGGMLLVVGIQGLRNIQFLLDSGAEMSSVSGPIGEEMLTSGVAFDLDEKQRFEMADGRILVKSVIYVTRLRVGDIDFDNVRVSVGHANQSLLLGTNVLNALKSWRIDNTGPYLEMTP